MSLCPLRRSFNPCSNGWCTSSLLPITLGSAVTGVSILVLMDGVLRAQRRLIYQHCFSVVSILVLMDGVLRDDLQRRSGKEKTVSILVLMDGVLRVFPNLELPQQVRFQSLF